MDNMILVHGIKGLAAESCYPYLASKAGERGIMPVMPVMENIQMKHVIGGLKYESWKKEFEETLKKHGVTIGADTIFLAHSLGSQFMIKYLAELQLEAESRGEKFKLGGLIALSAPRHVDDLQNDTMMNRVKSKFAYATFKNFKPSNKEFDAVKRIDCPKYCVYSDNDYYFTEENMLEYASAIDVPVKNRIMIPNKGHFTTDNNVYEVPEIVDIIDNLHDKNRLSKENIETTEIAKVRGL
jgi:predicted alpha/beta hydrolase family esterase